MAHRQRRGKGRRTAAPYAFLAPAIVFFTLFIVLPIGYAGYLSLRKPLTSGLGLGRGSRREVFAGLENYRSAATDEQLWSGVLRVLAYGGLLLPLMLGLALLFALLLDSGRAALSRFTRLSIFLPFAVPAVISSMLWGFLYLPAMSPLNYVLAQAGLPEPDLLSSDTVFYSIVNVALWGGVGFNMIVMYTSLRAIPRELYESARLDGCSEVQLALRIKIPLLVPSIIMTFLFSMIATLQVFSEPLTLRSLTNSITSTWSPLMKVYVDAFAVNDIYSAAAASVMIAAVMLVLSFGFLRLVQRRAFQEG